MNADKLIIAAGAAISLLALLEILPKIKKICVI